MENEDVVYTHNGTICSYVRKDEIMQFTATWKELEDVMLNVVSQKNIYRISHLYVVFRRRGQENTKYESGIPRLPLTLNY